MSRLEPEFHKLHWPPILVEGHHVPGHTCVDCKFIRSFNELNAYLSDLCGHDWRTQDWAVYWVKQHQQTKDDDRRDAQFENNARVKPLAPSVRRSGTLIRKLADDYFENDPKISSYKLCRLLMRDHDLHVSHVTAWKIIKKLRNKNTIKI